MNSADEVGEAAIPEESQFFTAPSAEVRVDRDRIFAGGDIHIFHSLDRLSQADPGEIQKIAASQIEILNSYYNTSLYQAKMSFRWALIAAGVGLGFLLGALASSLTSETGFASVIAAIAGAISEFVSVVNFWLYGRTLKQLNHFHDRLDQLQRFLLANSMAESLEPETREKARYRLVATIAGFSLDQPE